MAISILSSVGLLKSFPASDVQHRGSSDGWSNVIYMESEMHVQYTHLEYSEPGCCLLNGV